MSDLPSPRATPPPVSLTSLSLSAEEAGKAPQTKPTISVPPTQAAIPQSAFQRWEQRLTSMTSIGSGIALSLVLTVHALFFQLPKAAMGQVVAAREEAAGLAQDIANASSYQSIDLASLSNQVARAEEFLIPKRENVVGLVVETEKLCRQSGWKPDLVVRTAIEKTRSIDGATILPATLRLQTQPGSEALASSFDRLLVLLSQIDHFPYKVEIVSLSAVAERDASVSSAVIELHFWTRKANEKPAAK